MNRKKLIIGTTLAFLLCAATNAFAWSMSYDSYLNTGPISITGYSVTTATVTCSTISAYNAIYENGVLRAQKEKENLNSTSATTAQNSVSNHFGTQTWESYGIHNAVANGTSYLESSIKTANY